ncbi:hypothetical protein ABZZ74_23385 [Streptomyces sp. NPDC006476]|uniref:hypothetical protein n=1 Tax=Streptomyces sp. NPDC006476 TaxID=3157175 RepID=UPI0033BC5F5C
MYDLPEPPVTTTGQATNPLTDSVMQAAVRDLIHQTSYRNPDPNVPSHQDGPRVGTTPPVPQPDSRLVPQWALGVAVASIGVGAGTTGLGCAVWLACKGLASVIHSLSSVTLAGVLTVAIPFAGAAMLATAIGGAISKAKRAVVPEIHHHNGPEYHEHHTTETNTRAVWSKTINRH